MAVATVEAMLGAILVALVVMDIVPVVAKVQDLVVAIAVAMVE